MSGGATAERGGCAVCGAQGVDAALLEVCAECASLFHLNPRSDVPGIDCGDAWVGESLGVAFFCRGCIERMDTGTRRALGDPAQLAAMMIGAEPFALRDGLFPPAAARGDEGPPPRRQRPRLDRRYRRVDGA